MAVKYVLRPSAANSGTNTSHQLSPVNSSTCRATNMLKTIRASRWRKSSKVAKPSHWTSSLRENSMAKDVGDGVTVDGQVTHRAALDAGQSTPG